MQIISGGSHIEETEKKQVEALSLDEPSVSDSPALYNLVDVCKPLDLNSRYLYMLIPEHFAATSIVARTGDSLGGFISAYRVPGREETLFVWQVAVHPDFRKRGLAGQMIMGILQRSLCREVKFIETTVTPSNSASRRLFYHIAESLDTEVSEKTLFADHLFGKGKGHEEEVLFRIGPFSL